MTHKQDPAAEKLFLEIFEHFKDPVLLYDRNGTILKANTGVYESLGYRAEEMTGTNISDHLDNFPDVSGTFLRPGALRGFYLRLKLGVDMTQVCARIGYFDANLYSVKAAVTLVPWSEGNFLAVFTLLPYRLGVSYTDPFADLAVVADAQHRVLEYSNAFFSRFVNLVRRPVFHRMPLAEVFGAPAWNVILSKREEAVRNAARAADANKNAWRILMDGPFRESEWQLEDKTAWRFEEDTLASVKPVFFTSAILGRPVDLSRSDFRVEFEAMGPDNVSFFTFFCGKRRDYEGTPDSSGYLAGLRGPLPNEPRAMFIFKKRGIEMASRGVPPLTTGVRHSFAVEKAGARIRLFCDSEKVLEYTDLDFISDPLLNAVGLHASDRVEYRNLRLLARPASLPATAGALDAVEVVFPHIPECIYEIQTTVSQQREKPVFIYRLRDVTRARQAETALSATHRRERLLQQENLRLRERLTAEGSPLIGVSPEIEHVRSLISTLADTDLGVLITGETGTGKDVVAHALHANGPRAAQPFIKVDCAALPPALLESELFGHEKGAFTGAVEQKPGRFELAGAGSVFLDEIGNLDLLLQAKLLRVLQDRVFERVGGVQTLPVRARILCATHMDLEQRIRDGLFREDLFYRINAVRLALPPLRMRKADIPLLARHFAEEACSRNLKPLPAFDARFEKALLAHDWPGNIRELKNAIEYAVLLCNNEVVHKENLPAGLAGDTGRARNLSDSRGTVKPRLLSKEDVQKALMIAGNHRKQAARLLKIPRESFYRLLAKYKVAKKRKG